MLTGITLTEHFDDLTQCLRAREALWRPVPFRHPVLPWEPEHPSLAQALRTLADDEAGALEADPHALCTWLQRYLPALADVQALSQVPVIETRPANFPDRFGHGIHGRKWEQVRSFAGAMDHPRGAVIEWCAGKGHLGRAISQHFGVPVTGLEWQAALCEAGTACSRQWQLPVTLLPVDVLQAPAAQCLQEARHAVALHACGDLHRRLLESVVAAHTPGLHLAPCCYHLTAAEQNLPLSQAGRQSGLSLSRDELRLAVQETVTAGQRIRQRRMQGSRWRLAFDALQRECRGIDEYLPVPSLPDALLQGDFAAFCRAAAASKNLQLPATVDFAHAEQRGTERHRAVTRLELLRHAFRRPLELWLVLDRALYLQEHGYRVAVGTFCPRELTPRNLLIRACRD